MRPLFCNLKAGKGYPVCVYFAVVVPSPIRFAVDSSMVDFVCSGISEIDLPSRQFFALCYRSLPNSVLFQGDLFSPSVTYALSVRLRFADIEQGQKLGIFQNVISFYDGDNLLKTYSKSTYLKEPTFFNKVVFVEFKILIELLLQNVLQAMWVVFFPLYFCGMFHDYSLLEVPLTTAHTETSVHSSSKLLFQLQDRFAQV